MRLLNTSTLILKEFYSFRPEYAILSHTWGHEEDEVSFQEMQSGEARHREKRGFGKIARFCQVASMNGYQWVWIDTCCIDKSSSAELSEAINSMYRWYKESHVCYAYLEDVDEDDGFGDSRWFLRGWTLQELLAPHAVEFYDRRWNEIGTRHDMRERLSIITGIDVDALKDGLEPSLYTVALRMSWAANRATTREEDIAYCLLGIFEVHMPLLYGEGRKAFYRLQEEILKTTEDHTMLAWRNRPRGIGDMGRDPTSVFAQSPWDFRNDTYNLRFGGWDFTQIQLLDWNPFELREKDFVWVGCPSTIRFKSRPVDFEPPRKTARGLRITLPFVIDISPSDEIFREANLAFLYCFRRPKGEMVCLVLHEQDGINSSGNKGQFYRPRGGAGIHFIAPRSVMLQFRTVYIRVEPLLPLLRRYRNQAGLERNLGLILFGATRKPQLYKPQQNRMTRLLIHIRQGPVYFRLLSTLELHERRCCLSITTAESYEEERILLANDRLSALTSEQLTMQPQLRSKVILFDGNIEANLKTRPKGWLNLPLAVDLEEETRDLTDIYSLELTLSDVMRGGSPVLEVLEATWF